MFSQRSRRELSNDIRVYEKLNKEPEIIYGIDIKSNYQNQKLTLSKHFI